MKAPLAETGYLSCIRVAWVSVSWTCRYVEQFNIHPCLISSIQSGQVGCKLMCNLSSLLAVKGISIASAQLSIVAVAACRMLTTRTACPWHGATAKNHLRTGRQSCKISYMDANHSSWTTGFTCKDYWNFITAHAFHQFQLYACIHMLSRKCDLSQPKGLGKLDLLVLRTVTQW